MNKSHHTTLFMGVVLNAFLLITPSSNASDPFFSVCERGPEQIMSLALDTQQRLSLENSGGLGNGGVCWWHSRFQRAIWYLVEFNPNAPRPSRSEAKKLIHQIAHLSNVVVIPGYADFWSFSRDHEDLIQRELNQWQIRDGFINQAWIRGLSGRSQYSPHRAAELMDKLYGEYLGDLSQNQITWLKLQMPGIVAHAALLLSMEKDTIGNYRLFVIDSNFPDEIKTWYFRNGDRAIYSSDYDVNFMPFDGYERDFNKIKQTLNRHCR